MLLNIGEFILVWLCCVKYSMDGAYNLRLRNKMKKKNNFYWQEFCSSICTRFCNLFIFGISRVSGQLRNRTNERLYHTCLTWHAKGKLRLIRDVWGSLRGCVLVYRHTKEGNINELRHNSMYGYENKRNSLVYRYTRTAPFKGSGPMGSHALWFCSSLAP